MEKPKRKVAKDEAIPEEVAAFMHRTFAVADASRTEKERARRGRADSTGGRTIHENRKAKKEA